MGGLGSSVMAQSGAGRGKLPQAILYPCPQSTSSSPLSTLVLSSGHSVNFKPLLTPIEIFQQPGWLSHLYLEYWGLPYPHKCYSYHPPFIVISTKPHRHDEQLFDNICSEETGVWKQIWGRGHTLSCDRYGRFGPGRPTAQFCLSSSSWLFRTPASCFSARQPVPGASGVLPRSGHWVATRLP